ncbi:MAG: hypothetical protein IT372_37490 [Polyangiaceae bacterium]|nr:hypothetical protein [Polyangiaceae bacterium]
MALRDLEGFDEVMQKLLGSTPKERVAWLTLEQRLAGLTLEQRLAGLTLEQILLALPDDWVRTQPDEIRTPLEAVRDAVRKHQGR